MQLSKENHNRVQQKSTSNLSALMQDVLARAKAQGATEASVSVNHDSGFSVDVRMGEVETVSFNDDKGVSVVVYFGHQKGAASSTDTSSASIDALITAACDIAKVSAADPCFGLADKELMTNHFPDLDLYHPWAIKPAEAVEMALTCEAKALALDARIKN